MNISKNWKITFYNQENIDYLESKGHGKSKYLEALIERERVNPVATKEDIDSIREMIELIRTTGFSPVNIVKAIQDTENMVSQAEEELKQLEALKLAKGFKQNLKEKPRL